MDMRRVLLAAAIAVCSIFVAGAQAITTNGFPDNGQHPNVGAIMVPARSGVGFAEVCSGTLVSPTVFLTASHCTAFLEADPRLDYVTFDETDVEPFPSGLIEATPVTNPAYRGGYKDDVSVLVLKTPVTTIAPAQVPPRVGYLDALGLDQSTRLTVVGYGTSEKIIVKGENGPQFPFEGDRGYGIGGFNALTQDALKMSQNAAHGDSGACYGDSGGPTFLGAAPNDGDVVLAVTSTGDIPCYSTNVASRTDTPSARALLSRYGL
jgi:secreted trypsin-like serine protease